MIPKGYIMIHNWMGGFSLPSIPRPRHKYDIDLVVWPQAAKMASRWLHQDSSNERKLSPPGSPTRPSESSLERACTKTSLPRSGGDCLIVARTGYPGGAKISLAGDIIVRSSSMRNWHMIYKRSSAAHLAFRMSSCRRVAVNMPKCSLKTGMIGWRWIVPRVRLCSLVIDRSCGRHFCIFIGVSGPSSALMVRCLA